MRGAPTRTASSCCAAIERAMTALLLAATAAAQAPVRVATTAALRGALAAAKPGTVIAIASGDYDGFAIAGVAGSAGRPVVVRAEVPASPPRFAGGIHASDWAFVTIDGIVIEHAPANGLNVDDGGSFATPSHDVVLRNVTVRDSGGAGNDDGIKLSGVTD